MRIMGLDFGSKTVGVAVSDSLLVTAQGLEIVRRERADKLRRTLARIEELIEEYEVEEIVLGLPKNMNATEGERAELTEQGKAQTACGQDSGCADPAGVSGQAQGFREQGLRRRHSGRKLIWSGYGEIREDRFRPRRRGTG